MGLRIGQVSSVSPRLTVVVTPRADVVLSEVVLRIRRVGTYNDVGSYSPIMTEYASLVFEFDDALFNSQYGRYEGTLVANGNPYANLQFDYTAAINVNPALQVSTIEPYKAPPDCGQDITGTGNSGPGTLLFLKDTPKSYSGKAGMVMRVKADEQGTEFLPPSDILYYVDPTKLPPVPGQPTLALVMVAGAYVLAVSGPAYADWKNIVTGDSLT